MGYEIRGLEINTNHYMVVSKIEILTRKTRDISGAHRKEGFKVYLLHEESIREVYQKRLTDYA